ncbi:MAG TPA: holo-ACP synthase, partial [Actinomycetales bacterium]|nr:holo-ACP synthase [Actinomycetales bacterium]
ASGGGAGGGDADLARHLAGRWAVKEAVVKAWSAALYGTPPPIPPDLLRWSEIETVCDAWGRPSVRLGGEVARQVAATVGEGARWHVSLSHDGEAAVAFVVLEA